MIMQNGRPSSENKHNYIKTCVFYVGQKNWSVVNEAYISMLIILLRTKIFVPLGKRQHYPKEQLSKLLLSTMLPLTKAEGYEIVRKMN